MPKVFINRYSRCQSDVINNKCSIGLFLSSLFLLMARVRASENPRKTVAVEVVVKVEVRALTCN